MKDLYYVVKQFGNQAINIALLYTDDYSAEMQTAVICARLNVAAVAVTEKQAVLYAIPVIVRAVETQKKNNVFLYLGDVITLHYLDFDAKQTYLKECHTLVNALESKGLYEEAVAERSKLAFIQYTFENEKVLEETLYNF